MKILLYCLPALPLFACSLLKLAQVDQFCEEKQEPVNPQQSKKRTNQALFNPIGVSGNVNTPEIHRQVANFVPEMQNLFSKASKPCREAMAQNPVFLYFLVERLGIVRLKRIPFHCDLKVFEHFEFAKTPEGRVKAAALIFKMATTVLERSSIQPKLLEIVFDEFLDLAFASQDCFSHIVNMERSFSDCALHFKLIFYCFKSGRTADLIRMHKIIPLLSSLERLPINSLDDFIVFMKALITQFNVNPEDVKVICKKPFLASIFCVLASDLSMEIIKELLHDILAGIPFGQVLEWTEIILGIPLPPLNINPELFDSKVFELMNFSKSLHVSDVSSNDLANEEIMRSILRFRSESFLNPGELNDPELYGGDKMKFYLIAAGKYDKVIAPLPEIRFSEFHLEWILNCKELRNILASHKSEWFRKYFKAHKKLFFRYSNFFKVFFELSSISDFLERGASGDLEIFAAFIFIHGSLHEIELLTAKVHVCTLADLFETLFEIEIDFDRFKAILSILILIKDANSSKYTHIREKLTLSYLHAKPFIKVLEVGGVGLFNRLFRWSPAKELFTLIRQVLLDPELRAKIMPFQADLLALFPKGFCFTSEMFYSPTEFYSDIRFYNLRPVEFLKNVLSAYFQTYEKEQSHLHDYFLNIVSLSRYWFELDPTIANYSGEDFVQKTVDESNQKSKEFCQSVYSSLTKLGKSILRFIFAEAVRFRPQLLQQPAAVAEGGDA